MLKVASPRIELGSKV